MKDSSKTKAQLINEIIEMRKQIAEQKKSEFESKRVEKALRESKEHYHTLFNLSPSGIILTDSKGLILMVNNSFCKYNGYTPDELKGNNIKILVPDDKHNNVNLHIHEILSGKILKHEAINITKDRKYRNVELHETKISLPDGKIGILSIANDITERKQAEEALKKAHALYRSLFEGVPVGLYRTNRKGKIIDINQTAVHMLGYPDKQTLMRINVSDLYVNTEDRQRWQAMIERDKIVLGFELQFRQYDNTIIWVRDSARIVRHTNGQTLYYDGSLEDITKRKRLEAQLIQAQKMEAIGILAGGVAHDFNNILQVIRGHNDLVMMKVDETDPLYIDIKQIDLSAKRAASLTRQLLFFSRRQQMECTPVNLNTRIDNLLKMLHRLIGEDISINTELDPELWTVKVDAGNIEQAIMNLTINARDAMPEGGTLTIKTQNINVDEDYCKTYTYAHPGKFVCLTIEDTGIGMDKETIQHIFEPFFSTKRTGKGTGLGLSVVYGIVKQHKGWVIVYSEPGQGSTLKVYLPAVSIKPKEESKEKISLEEVQGNGERILLVEDEEEVLGFTTKALAENGYIVYEAANAEKALNIFEKEAGNFDLIFSDVVLPGKTGLELVDQLLSRKPELRVLLSSGYTHNKSQWPVIKKRGFKFLQKPYALADLLRAIREVIV